MSAMDDNTVKVLAREIADSIIESARMSGDDPIAWVTGNRYVPAMRSFPQAETVWQSDENADGELFAYLVEEIERILSDENVALESPEWDNALYAVDLTRFEYVDEDERPYVCPCGTVFRTYQSTQCANCARPVPVPHETLQQDWRMYNSGTIH